MSISVLSLNKCQKSIKLEKSGPVAIFGSILALLVIFLKYLSSTCGQKSAFVKAGSKVIDCTIQLGAIGTIIGFILAIIGSFFLKRECDKRKGEH